MARIRSLKPEFWDDRKLARSTSRDARMLYMGLWNQADEHGRTNGDPLWIKGRVFSYEDDLDVDAVDELLTELVAAGRVVRYVVDGDPYLFLPKLEKHQRLEPGKAASKYPDPELAQIFPDGPAQNPDEQASDVNKSALLYGTGSMLEGAPRAEKPRQRRCAQNHPPEKPCSNCKLDRIDDERLTADAALARRSALVRNDPGMAELEADLAKPIDKRAFATARATYESSRKEATA